MVLRDGLHPILIGVASGIPIALAAATLMAPLLFGVRPGDPLILAAAALTMTAVASGAALIPARRAAAIDPLAALRDG